MNDIIFRVIVPDNKILFKTLMIKGERGLQGTSIVSIEKTQTIGLTDYYTISLNDGTTYEFTVQNGTSSYFDDEFSLVSENAVQNKVITAALNTIDAALVSIQQYDNALSLSSENAVQNKVVAAAINSINTTLALIQQYDSALSASSENAVQNKVVKAALDLKANLTALNSYYTKSQIDTAFNNLGASNITYNNSSSGLSATDVQAAIDEINNALLVSREGIGTLTAVNATVQIPNDVLAKSIIVIVLRRYGYFGTITVSKSQLTQGAYAAGTQVYGDNNNSWKINISNSGVITLLNISGTAFPNVDCYGLL